MEEKEKGDFLLNYLKFSIISKFVNDFYFINIKSFCYKFLFVNKYISTVILPLYVFNLFFVFQLIENLRKDLSDGNKVVSQFQRFYLSVSLQSSHNHPPIIIRPKLKIPKPKSHKILIKSNKIKKSIKKEDLSSDPIEIGENDWSYVELASSSISSDQEPREEIPVKTLNLKDESFFHTLVKFPNTTSNIFEPVEYKPDEIEIEIKPFEPTENTSTIEVYEYQPTIQDLQTLFKEKLKNLYTLCSNCSNASLILRLASDLEQVEMQLSNDVNYSNL